MQETEKIWMNGELVDWADAKVHVGAHGLHYGSGVFEGIRCYETDDGPAVFRLTDHLKRLENSARLLHMELPIQRGRHARGDARAHRGERARRVLHPPDRLLRLRRAGRASALEPDRRRDHELAVGRVPRRGGAHAGNQREGLVWKRVGPNTIPHVSKATGIYLNSMLAVIEATNAGYAEAILLTDEGHVADGSGENIFVVKDEIISTPHLSTSILPGITRQSVMEIAQAHGYAVHEGPLIRSDLYLADEVFMTGTAAEVTPVRAIDDHEIGPPGPVTKAIQSTFFDVVRGRDERWTRWLEYAAKAPAGS